MIPLVFDENLSSRQVENALCKEGMYHAFGEYFTRGMSDGEVLEVVGAKGLCLITQDKGFYSFAKNIPDIVRCNARAILIDKIGDMPRHDAIPVLLKALPVCQRFADKHPAPFSAKYSPTTNRMERARLP